MANIFRLLNRFIAYEEQLYDAKFIAPCASGGMVQTRVAGIVYRFAPNPRNFEGWGIFQPINEKTAKLIEAADLPLISEYLNMLKPLRLRLVHALQNRTWLAYPINESDARRRCGKVKPVAVNLVNDSAQFEQIIARWDGNGFWFEDIDRRADPMVAEQLKEALRSMVTTKKLLFAGLTPEMRTAYDLATQQTRKFRAIVQRQSDETRLRSALKIGGAKLQEFRDQGAYWLVEWTTSDGSHHTSAIEKSDLTVMSAGICLSGRDRDFDLQSIVRVMEES